MGRRKERRLAALGASGRRVKLDLSAEPTGEAASPAIHQEVDLDKEERADIPTSPSSGQKPQNPLLLLGQYSDDEVDGSTTKSQKLAHEESSSMESDSKVDESIGRNEDSSNTDKDTVSSNVKSESNLVDAKLSANKEAEKAEVAGGVGACSAVGSTINVFDPCTLETQIAGDATYGWKTVIHEESNQYYYWNTLTGETSWEVPKVLAQASETSSEQVASLIPEAITKSTLYLPNDPVNFANDGLISNSVTQYASESSAGLENIGALSMAHAASQSIVGYGPSQVGVYGTASGTPEFNIQYPGVSDGQLATLADICVTQGHENGDELLIHESHLAKDVDSSQIIAQLENLLEKLKAMERCEWSLKYISEVETRLCDCKAFSLCGSPLLPFWRHTSVQLNRLESVVQKEVSPVVKSEGCNKVDDGKCSTHMETEKVLLGDGIPPVEIFNTTDTNVSNGGKQLSSETFSGIYCVPPCKTEGAQTQLVSEDAELPTTSNLKPSVDSHIDEDMDMDVEMEVDEEYPTSQQHSGGELPHGDPLKESMLPPNSADDLHIPRPPDEEWIPPPPPDTEPVPPPPPDEPPVPPLPNTESAPIFPLMEQYNPSYSVPSFPYYSYPNGDSHCTATFAPVEVNHVVEAQPVQYYEPAASSAYPSVAAPVLSEPVAYFDTLSGTVPSIHVATSSDSSSLCVVSGSFCHAGVNQTESKEVGAITFSSQKNDTVSASAGHVVEKVFVQADEAPALHLDISDAPENGNVGGASTTTSSTKSKESSKNPSKVARSKKRAVAVAPTLRSNKKVSSLVDKWKAAKEELLEDEEEEPDDPYEALEKKRQKEIEEWHARQIASGEAQDNANFVPLGGDWRKRVKRRKAESSPDPVGAPSKEVVTEKKKPDLVELARGPPSGWQVYWDESSKEIYYGNLKTSKTTWTRPSS